MVERGLILPQGWTGVAVDGEALSSETVHQRVGDPLTAAVPDLYQQVELRVEHGLLPRVSGWLSLGHGWARVHGGLHDQRYERHSGLMDPAMGLRWSVVQDDARGHHLAVETGWQSGTEAWGNVRPEQAWDALHVGVAARERLGALAVSGQADWVMRPPCCAGQAVDWGVPATDVHQRVDPGDGPRVVVDALLQAGPLLGRAGIDATWRGRLDLWPEGVILTTTRERYAEGDVWVGGGLQLTRGVALDARWSRPWMRRDWSEGPWASLDSRVGLGVDAWF